MDFFSLPCHQQDWPYQHLFALSASPDVTRILMQTATLRPSRPLNHLVKSVDLRGWALGCAALAESFHACKGRVSNTAGPQRSSGCVKLAAGWWLTSWAVIWPRPHHPTNIARDAALPSGKPANRRWFSGYNIGILLCFLVCLPFWSVSISRAQAMLFLHFYLHSCNFLPIPFDSDLPAHYAVVQSYKMDPL